MDVTHDVLPTTRVGSIPEQKETRWLIEKLWLENACGLIGGQPKCCKSWLGLDMAVSTASGTPCLGIFPVLSRGPALVFMAEDRLEEVRERVNNIAQSRNLALETLDVHLITTPVLRLDLAEDCSRLDATISAIKPRLLLLDPLVRLHRLDENSAKDISGLLGFLRELERKHHVAIVLTHHAGKKSHSRPGQGLRGSGDLHAFGDSNAYLARKGENIELVVEHRFAEPIEPLTLQLVNRDGAHLEQIGTNAHPPQKEDLATRITAILRHERTPLSRNELRERLRINNQRLGQALNALVAAASITSTQGGISLVR